MRKQRLLWKIVVLAAVLLIPAAPALADSIPPRNGITIWGEDYTVESDETVEGDLVVINGDVTIADGGTVEGSVVIWGGNADIEGRVEGDLVISNGDIYLGDDASIEGDVVCSGNCDLEQEEGAYIDGSIVENIPLPPIPPIPNIQWEEREFPKPVQIEFTDPSWFMQTAFGIVRRMIMVVLVSTIAILVGLMLPQQVAIVEQAIVEAPLPSAGYGFLTACAGLAAIVLLAITICLFPIAFLAGVALFAAALYGWICCGSIVGQKLLDAMNAKDVSPAWVAGLGTLVITLVAALIDSGLNIFCCCLQPFIWLLVFVVICAGLGSVVLTRFGTMPYMSTGTPPTTIEPTEPSEPEEEA